MNSHLRSGELRSAVSDAASRRTRAAACVRFRTQVRRVASGEREPGARTAAHIEACLVCQAELSRARVVERELVAMRDVVAQAPPSMVAGALATPPTPLHVAGNPDDPQHRAARRHSPAATAAAASAVSAVAIGVVIVASRRLRSPAA